LAKLAILGMLANFFQPEVEAELASSRMLANFSRPQA